MFNMMHRLIFAFCTFALTFMSRAQELEGNYLVQELKKNDILTMLPPIDSLVAMAYELSPELAYGQADQLYWKSRLRLSQTRWLDYFYVEGLYNYGVFDNLTSQMLTGAPQTGQTLLSTEQSRYSFGASVKIPISAILNRSNDIRAARAEYKRSLEGEKVGMAKVREEVIKRYGEVVKAQRLLFVLSDMVDTYKVQSVRAKEEYLNGIIPVAEYTRLTQMYNESVLALESQKSDFSLALLLLEEITGFKLNI